MSESKRLTVRQRAVIEDLFADDLEEKEVLEKNKVKRHQGERWLADERFTEQLRRRIAHAQFQSRILLARYATVAALKLVELTHCEKEETARKACLDIITMNAGDKQPADGDSMPTVTGLASLSAETAGRLLAALAKNSPDGDGDTALDSMSATRRPVSVLVCVTQGMDCVNDPAGRVVVAL